MIMNRLRTIDDYGQRAYPYKGLKADERMITSPYSHQSETVEWMLARERDAPVEGISGGFVWHDMGLGKTYCALACTVLAGGRTLVVCPAQLTHVWIAEAQRHFKGVDAFLYYGPARREAYRKYISDRSSEVSSQVIVTAYTTVISDIDEPLSPFSYGEDPYERLILDESHFVKNAKTHAYQAVERVRSRVKWLLSGTPLPNSVTEMFPYLKILGYRYVKNSEQLSKKAFTNKFMTRTGYLNMQNILKRVAIRRTKEILDLPERTIRDVAVTMADEEREFYTALKDYSKDRLKKLMRNLRSISYSALGRQIQARLRMINIQSVLSLIFHLRLACCDPQLVINKIPRIKNASVAEAAFYLRQGVNKEANCPVCFDDEACWRHTGCGHQACRSCWDKLSGLDPPLCFECMSSMPKGRIVEIPSSKERKTSVASCSTPQRSSKTHAIIKRVAHELARGEKIIVVSQWTSYLDVLIAEFTRKYPDTPYATLTGQVSPTKRQKIINTFQEQAEPRVLFASLGSSGEGVTLTAACRMVIAEPYWNQAKIAQVGDRVYRIGQKQAVKMYCMFVEGTIEKKVLELAEKKSQCVSVILDCKKITGSVESFLNRVVRLLDD